MMSEQCQFSADDICRNIYSQTKVFYGQMSEGRTDDCGFQILYGPPYYQAPILFIGYQPGRGTKSPAQERIDGSEDRWPLRSEYSTEDWPLAQCLRNLFGQELIERCVGLNAIFIRSNNIKQYEKQFDRALRTRIKTFCLSRVEQMVHAIQPVAIVAIGLASLDLFGGSTKDKRGEKGRVLTKLGKIAGRNALGVLHLTGAYISREDRGAIADEIRAFKSGSSKN
jgi:hypothetical protein